MILDIDSLLMSPESSPQKVVRLETVLGRCEWAHMAEGLPCLGWRETAQIKPTHSIGACQCTDLFPMSTRRVLPRKYLPTNSLPPAPYPQLPTPSSLPPAPYPSSLPPAPYPQLPGSRLRRGKFDVFEVHDIYIPF